METSKVLYRQMPVFMMRFPCPSWSKTGRTGEMRSDSSGDDGAGRFYCLYAINANDSDKRAGA